MNGALTRAAPTAAEECARVRGILTEARTWLGTPFAHQAQLRGQGVDCVQFLIAVYRATGCLPPDFSYTTPVRGWHLRDARYLRFLEPHTVPRAGVPQPADIAMFRNRLPSGRALPFPCHAAIVIAWPSVIHADPELGVVEVADCARGLPGPFSCALIPCALAGVR